MTFVAVLAHIIAGSLFDGVAMRRIMIILISATLPHDMPGKTSVSSGGNRVYWDAGMPTISLSGHEIGKYFSGTPTCSDTGYSKIYYRMRDCTFLMHLHVLL